MVSVFRYPGGKSRLIGEMPLPLLPVLTPLLTASKKLSVLTQVRKHNVSKRAFWATAAAVKSGGKFQARDGRSHTNYVVLRGDLNRSIDELVRGDRTVMQRIAAGLVG